MKNSMIAMAIVFATASVAYAGEKIDFGGMIEQGMKEKKVLNKKMIGLMEEAEYEQESKEVMEFVQEELEYLNENQQVVDSEKQDAKDAYIY